MVQEPRPSLALAYINVANSQASDLCAMYFLETYQKNPPGAPVHPILVCNGGNPNPVVAQRARDLGFEIRPRSNDGWDIGAYLELSRDRPEDLLVCLGESVHLHRRGWLERIAQAWSKSGPGFYGTLASFMFRPHLNTSAFACTPALLAEHPKVFTKAERYDFEHGHSSMWNKVAWKGLPTKLVTWDGEYDPSDWRKPKNGLWNGDQSNCLVYCNHTDRYVSSNAATRAAWSRGADGFSFKRNPTQATQVLALA